MRENPIVIRIDFPSVIRVDFPALTDLVTYLRDRADQQEQIDALAAQVAAATTELEQSRTGLQGSVDNQKK